MTDVRASRPTLVVLVAIGTALAACGDGEVEPADAGAVDAGRADASSHDAGRADAGAVDAGRADASSEDAGSDAGCPDGDGDGVCDALDRCAGHDDAADADADGTPDGCDCDALTCLETELCREADDGAACLTDADGDGWEAAVDCDDGDPEVHPEATERCNGVDDDCDPATPEPAAILRDGMLEGDAAVALSRGGLVEICGAFPLRLGGLPRLANAVTVRGHGEDAALLAESGRLVFETGVDATFESLRIAAAPADELKGIRVREATLTLRDVHFEGLQTAISADLATVVMRGGRIVGSREDAAVYLDRSTGTFTDVVFEDNETRDSRRGGGALFVGLGGSVELMDCTLRNNRNALGVGGAVYVGEAPSQDWGSARLRATGCDWGAGAMDNAPDDLVVWFGAGTSSVIVDDVSGDLSCVANSLGNSCTAL